MRPLFRTVSLGLIYLLFIAYSNAAINLYGYRIWRSAVAAQSVSVVVVNPGANQTPDSSQGGSAVSGQSNTGHGNTNVYTSAYGNGNHTLTKTCLWYAFQNVPGVKARVTLKFDWAQSGNLDATTLDRNDRASASSSLSFDYSTNNGGSWTSLGSVNHFTRTVVNGDSDSVPISDLSSVSVDLPNPGAIDITQIRVRDKITTNATASSFVGDASATADVTMSISNIRLEVEAVDCIASVPADRWKGEYFNNQTLSGVPTMVRDDTDGAGFLNLNFGGGSPHSACAPAVDNFSARWTRTVNLAAGIYRFTTSVDNGVRLYVDGYLRIDKWGDLAPNTYTADVFLSAGAHEIRLEFIEYTGGASVSLSWAAVSGANCIASVPADRWRGEYYSNPNLAGSTAMVRDDGASSLNFNFGDGGPGGTCGLGVDYFSARWTRRVNFAAGIYRFTATADDGVRLYVDGQLKIDAWVLQAPTTYTADVTLSAGPHEIRMEYFEYAGGATAILSWADFTNCLANVPAGKWQGEYYNNITLTGPVAMIRNDGALFLNFDFGLGSPSAACGVNADNFSARWTRTVNLAAGAYRFSVTGDDGVRLYVDGQLKIDKWFPQGAATYTADVTLSAGAHEVKLEYFESGGPGVAFLSWADPTGVNCLPNAPLPLISSVPQTVGRENIASTAPSQAPKRCGQKNSD